MKIIESVKPYATKSNIALMLVVLVILFEVGKIFYGKTPDNYKDRHAQLEKSVKALEQNDKVREGALKVAREQRSKDSAQLASIKNLVENVPFILNQLTIKYEKDRRNLAAMPFDARFLFFANYITQGDSVAKRRNGDNN
jgi:hypothetical protein